MGSFAGYIPREQAQSLDQIKKIGALIGNSGGRVPKEETQIWSNDQICIAVACPRRSHGGLKPEEETTLIWEDDSLLLAIDGVIYNSSNLYKELESAGLQAPDKSEAAIVATALKHFGLFPVLKKLNGLFSLVALDRRRHQLHIARDPIGARQLYFGWKKNEFLFGSQLRPLRGHPEWDGGISHGALTLLLRYGFVPAPYCIFDGLYKLLPGNAMSLSLEHARSGQDNIDFNPFPGDGRSGVGACPVVYWSAVDKAWSGAQNLFDGTEAEALNELEILLREKIIGSMIGNLNTSVIFSGGIDSSTVLALTNAISSHPTETYTIGFQSEDFNEAHYAKKIAEALGSVHSETYLRAEQYLAVIPRLPEFYEEPFSNSPSCIPGFLAFDLASRSGSLCLTGDGGDHVFMGANRFIHGIDFWNKVSWMPRLIRSSLGSLLDSFPISFWEMLSMRLNQLRPDMLKGRSVENTVFKVVDFLKARNLEEWYVSISSVFGPEDRSRLLLNCQESPVFRDLKSLQVDAKDPIVRAIYLAGWELLGMSDGIMGKVVPASKGAGLVAHFPLLDTRVIEFAYRLPVSMRIRDKKGKWILRQLLYKYVTKELVDRPKTGFEVPISEWIRGPLKDWAEDLLSRSFLEQTGFFNPHIVRSMWKEHLSRKRDRYFQLWNILIFNEWLRSNQL